MSVSKINSFANNLLRTGDRQIDRSEAEQLIRKAQDKGKVTAPERDALKQVLTEHADKFTTDGARVLAEFLGLEPPVTPETDITPPVTPGTQPTSPEYLGVFRSSTPYDGQIEADLKVATVDQAGTPNVGLTSLVPVEGHRQVYLSSDGMFVTSVDGEAQQTLATKGEGLFRAASIMDDYKGNLFVDGKVSLDTRRALFTDISASLDQVLVNQPLPEGFNDLQALQLRSSGATVLLEMTTSLRNSGDDLSLKQQTFDRFVDLVKAETNPVLRESMIFNAHLVSDSLAPEMKATANSLMRELAPLEPPYEKWFANGNNTVNIDVSVGQGFTGHEKIWENNGFKRDPADSNVFVKKITNRDGVETEFRLRKRELRGDMFEKLDDPNVHMTVYDGHSNWGLNVRSSLDNSRMTGTGEGKVALVGLCVGKGELNMIRDKFPDAQVVTTYNSSYFGPGEANMSWSENQNTMMTMIDQIAERRPWTTIAREVRNEVIEPHSYWHAMDNNYLFPTDTMLRRRVLDRDHDGQADIFDKFVDFSTFKTPEDTAREFSSQPPTHPATKLVGTKPHMAVQGINRLSLYSELLEPRNNSGRVVSGGYFQPTPGDKSVVKFERIQLENGHGYQMKVNSNYSHMSEESLRAVAMYEFNSYLAQTDARWPLNDVDTKLQGLILASHSLDTDAGYRDSTVWKEFLKTYNFPPSIERYVVEQAKTDGEGSGHHYSGSREAVSLLRKALGTEVINAISSTSSGHI